MNVYSEAPVTRLMCKLKKESELRTDAQLLTVATVLLAAACRTVAASFMKWPVSTKSDFSAAGH